MSDHDIDQRMAAPDEAAKRTRVAQWLMDQFDGDRHLSVSGHTIAIRNHPEREMWFSAADELLNLMKPLAAPADRTVSVTDSMVEAAVQAYGFGADAQFYAEGSMMRHAIEAALRAADRTGLVVPEWWELAEVRQMPNRKLYRATLITAFEPWDEARGEGLTWQSAIEAALRAAERGEGE